MSRGIRVELSFTVIALLTAGVVLPAGEPSRQAPAKASPAKAPPTAPPRVEPAGPAPAQPAAPGADAAANPSGPDAKADRFRGMRCERDERGRPLSLQTAIVRYVSDDEKLKGLKVDLVGAVHIGDKAYYDALNDEFTHYDTVLYELVAAKGAIPTRERAEQSPLSNVQMALKDALDLEFQLEQIDYTKKNFVHADVTPDEFVDSMKRRNETIITMIVQLMHASILAQENRKRPPPNDFVMISALMDKKNGPRILKRIFAGEIEETDVILDALNGPAGSTLLTERNRAALKVLKEQITAGKRKIAIFYGAAHLLDFDEQLRSEFGLRRESTRWLTAWDLRSKKAAAEPAVKPAAP